VLRTTVVWDRFGAADVAADLIEQLSGKGRWTPLAVYAEELVRVVSSDALPNYRALLRV
jgi:hypothetical protein